ncbi:hypothetical protein PGT21_012127 [Puccinia graminis f. sp. tritici]|uniref:Uncharacterized protein n=1 Tax=Puccinia graminis f. sp. tritici TaxID=56615 RepID=A0A5B0LW30_PUCGR|nr:hypothetical protein PGT21_012127 [Puccinia graminis f. sp. tritici]KAA1123569.1 hypothetical protein PGTUg99_015432 [Puccinia graminis f. sp. tritici]
MAIPPFYIHAPRCSRAPQLGGRFEGFHRGCWGLCHFLGYIKTSPSDSQIVLQAPSAIESNTQLAYQQFASLPFKANP